MTAVGVRLPDATAPSCTRCSCPSASTMSPTSSPTTRGVFRPRRGSHLPRQSPLLLVALGVFGADLSSSEFMVEIFARMGTPLRSSTVRDRARCTVQLTLRSNCFRLSKFKGQRHRGLRASGRKGFCVFFFLRGHRWPLGRQRVIQEFIFFG